MRGLLRDESGQAITEYVLILSVVVFFATTLVRNFLKILDEGVLRIGAQLERDLKTGRAPVRVWRN